jgi:hypothetical protein
VAAGVKAAATTFIEESSKSLSSNSNSTAPTRRGHAATRSRANKK